MWGQQGQGLKVTKGDNLLGHVEQGSSLYNFLNSYFQAQSLITSFSSTYPNPLHNNYHLDEKKTPAAWSAHDVNQNQYAQVASSFPLQFLGVILQGRQDEDQWVTKFRVLYSNDGNNFTAYQNGKEFQGVHDRNTKKEIQFTNPIKAKVLRICPTAWNGHISMRFNVLHRQAL